jgi:hypothetical protein
LYRDISERGAGCHMLGAGAVEHFYCKLSPKIFDAYIRIYGMTAHQLLSHDTSEREYSKRNLPSGLAKVLARV